MYESRIKCFEHKGKKMWDFDFSNLGIKETIQMIDEIAAVEERQPLHSMLVFNNFTNMNFSMSLLNEFNKDIKIHNDRYIAAANLGVKGLIKIMFEAAAKMAKDEKKCFEDRNDALNWLASK